MIWTIHSDSENFWKLHLDIVSFHKKLADNLILLKYVKKVKLFNKLVCISGISTVLACIVYPIFDSTFLAKKKVLCFGFVIPFVDPYETLGYFLTFTFQIAQALILGYGYVVFNRFYWQYFAHANVRIDILKSNVENLNEYITDNDDEEHIQLLMAVKLNEIVELHNDYLRFLN